jgi:RsiW-degrading membrane proteinase PrsW (M82 family)
MPKRLLSTGLSMILVTSVFYLIAIIAVMTFVIDGYDSQSTEKVESVFWAAGILGIGIVPLVVLQFVLNMYVLKPLSDFRAASLILANAFIAGVVLKYFLSISIGS